MEKPRSPEMMAEIGAETGKEAEPKAYTLEADPQFLDFKRVQVTATDESKPWKPATRVRVERADGSVQEEVDANAAAFTFQDRKGRKLTVSIAAAGHIDSLHIKGEDAGSKFDQASLQDLFRDMADKMPESLADDVKRVDALSVEMSKHMGKEGIASLDELVADGIVSAEQVAEARSAKDEVKRLNRDGSKEEREAFVEQWQKDHPDSPVQFQVVRGEALVPTVAAPKRDTTKLFMVFGPNAAGDQKTLYTIAPGRNMPRHPIAGQHKSKEGVLNEDTFNESADAWFETAMLTGK